MRKIALATSNEYSELTNDDRLVLGKLLYWGVDIQPIVWDSKDVAWNQYDAVFIRSCWDYHLRHEEFFKWIDTVASQGITFFNAPEILRWNSIKTYLKDIAQKEVSVVPTVFRNQSEGIDLRQILSENGWDRAVLKPTISANADNTWITEPDALEENQKKARKMMEKHGQILIQKFISDITKNGEWSFIFFDSVYSHSVLKKPKAGDFRVQEHVGGISTGKKPPGHLPEQARVILEKTAPNCVYARVDGIEVDGKLMLMELELIEPALYLEHHPKAPERFAEAIMNAVNLLAQEQAVGQSLQAGNSQLSEESRQAQ